MNVGGTLRTATYGKVCAVHLDPIEKKPLYHFYPTSTILSVGAIGCSFSCPFCQNWELVEGLAPLQDCPPETLAKIAEKYKIEKNVGVPFTYNEPIIWYEYIIDTAKVARERNLKIVLVTNGFINPKPLEELIPYIDAMNIDLKFADDYKYKNLSGGHLKPVLKTIQTANKNKVHVEVTYLMVTDTNDSAEDMEKVTELVASIDPEIPFHISRYFPHHQFKKSPTTMDRLSRGYEIARRKLKYVYMGNVWGEDWGNTYCPGCSKPVIRRVGYSTDISKLDGKHCKECGYEIRLVV
jgi:pyruvate formate lyase activating enzyme